MPRSFKLLGNANTDIFKYVQYLIIFLLFYNMAFSGGVGGGRGEAFKGEAGRAEDLQR